MQATLLSIALHDAKCQCHDSNMPSMTMLTRYVVGIMLNMIAISDFNLLAC